MSPPARNAAAERGRRRGDWFRRLGIVGVLAILVAFGAGMRLYLATADPNFDRHSTTGMLRSDPGLLYYFLQRIVESGGKVPNDFRSDPNIEFPDTSDVPAMFTVGQEFVIAWLYLALGADVPLHVFCAWVMSIFAALCVFGVYGLARELTGRTGIALIGAALFVVLPANYRTTGLVLMREDFCLPWYALHLFVLARAVRVRTPLSFLASGLTLAAALSTWHAMTFVVTIEMLCMFAWYVRSGANPLTVRWAWLVPAIVATASVLVPVLRSKTFLLSLPMQMVAAMLVSAVAARFGIARARVGSLTVAGLAWAVFFVLAGLVSRSLGGGMSDYSHVFELMIAKVRFLGHMPEDPRSLSFGARLLWQGPFASATVSELRVALGIGLVLMAASCIQGIKYWRRPGQDGGQAVLAAFMLASLLTAWLVRRTVVLGGLLAPVAAAALLAQVETRRLWYAAAVVGMLVQVLLFSSWARQHRIPWYEPERNQLQTELIEWVAGHAPPGEPIAADFVNGTAILSHTRNPMLLQPKYETRSSRRRIEEFLTVFFSGTPDEFASWLRAHRCRYVLIDRQLLCEGGRNIAGIPRTQPMPNPNTAAAALCGPVDVGTEIPPGFRLLYRAKLPGGADLFRVYELE